MANRTALAGHIAMKLARLSSAILVLFSIAAPAHADPVKYAIVDAAFDDGGTATGYVLYETRPAPESPRVTDWAITVTAGASGIWFFVYDPTNSAVTITPGLMSFVGPAWSAPLCGGQARHIQFDRLQFGALAGETCQASRQFVSGEFQQLPGPFLTLKAYNQHPASRVVYGGGGVNLTLDISPAGWTAPLDWYFAIVRDLNVYWVTPNGLSLTPASFAHAAPVLVSNVPLLSVPLNGNTQTTFVIVATDGTSMIAYDHIMVIVPPSP